MEEFIRRRRRPKHIMVDPAMGYRVEDRLARRRIAKATPVDQQPALRLRMEVTSLIQQLAPSHPRKPLPGKDQAQPASPAAASSCSHAPASSADSMQLTR